ncbi:MAG TPA: hypothetical protein VGL88_12725 [Pseudonocardiaceae bacterium]|jgi:hypothetical protein
MPAGGGEIGRLAHRWRIYSLPETGETGRGRRWCRAPGLSCRRDGCGHRGPVGGEGHLAARWACHRAWRAGIGWTTRRERMLSYRARRTGMVTHRRSRCWVGGRIPREVRQHQPTHECGGDQHRSPDGNLSAGSSRPRWSSGLGWWRCCGRGAVERRPRWWGWGNRGKRGAGQPGRRCGVECGSRWLGRRSGGYRPHGRSAAETAP